MSRIALAGNPNSGKTTLFNALSGAHQRVGNWPGVTVEKKSGEWHGGDETHTLVDLPGTYSLTPSGQGLDEQIARECLVSGEVDLVVNVIEATSLSRGLYLTSELAELGLPTVVVINMIDVAQAEGIEVDTAVLAERLGCPVVAVVATQRKSLAERSSAVEQAAPCQPFASGDETTR